MKLAKDRKASSVLAKCWFSTGTLLNKLLKFSREQYMCIHIATKNYCELFSFVS